MKTPKTLYVCKECSYSTSKWLGKCPNCGAWNSFDEEIQENEAAVQKSERHALSLSTSNATKLTELDIPDYMRTDTGMNELNRVLGSGLVDGSVVLISGEPGIGKSTLLLQICENMSKKSTILYVSGEESQGQLKMRANRLNIKSGSIYILTETNVEKILLQTKKINPDIMIIDSIQTTYLERVNSTSGSITQVKESAMAFINKAKGDGMSIILVGHVNKEGTIAGPKILEHMVDAVLYFEGERQQSYRIIRAIKNRYGSTNEIGVFEMTDKGLAQIENPSEMLLKGRPIGISGNCAVCIMEGTRPILAEIQALITKTFFPSPRRTSSGIDYNRMSLIIAVLEKRLGLRFSANDVYLNVVNGLKIDDPSCDLAIALALISSIKDIAVPDDVIAIGELGLAGEIRFVPCIAQRINESVRLGFKRIVVPSRNFEDITDTYGAQLIKVKSIFEALKIFELDKKNNQS